MPSFKIVNVPWLGTRSELWHIGGLELPPTPTSFSPKKKKKQNDKPPKSVTIKNLWHIGCISETKRTGTFGRVKHDTMSTTYKSAKLYLLQDIYNTMYSHLFLWKWNSLFINLVLYFFLWWAITQYIYLWVKYACLLCLIHIYSCVFVPTYWRVALPSMSLP